MDKSAKTQRWSRFRLRILVPFIILNLLVIGTIWLLAQVWATRLTEDRSRDEMFQLLEKTAAQLDGALSEMDKAALYVATNPGILQAFQRRAEGQGPVIGSQPFDSQYQALIDILLSIYTVRDTVTRISIFNDKGDYLSFGLPEHAGTLRSRLAGRGFPEWYRSLARQGASNYLAPHQDFWGNDHRLLVSDVREIRTFSSPAPYALVEVQEDVEGLSQLADLSGKSTIRSWLFFEGKLVFGPAQGGDFQAGALAGLREARIADSRGARYMAFGTGLSHGGWRLVFTEPAADFNESATVVSRITLVIGLGLLLASLMSVIVISARVSRPLVELYHSVQAVSLENLAISIPTQESDEVKQLSDAFQTMFLRLQAAVEETIHARSREMNAQLLAMQAQMNPHFIFNTLQVISAAGQEAKSPSVVRICGRLSRIIRYVSNFSDSLPSLSEELEHTRTYLELMSDRFEKSFTWTLDVDADLSELRLPRLSIQPLVENCFEHGFSGLPPPWSIDVRGFRLNERLWRLEVRDNGIGMSEEIRAGLLARIDEHAQAGYDHLKSLLLDHVGLINTYIRLRLLYGESADLGIESGAAGTLVWLQGGFST